MEKIKNNQAKLDEFITKESQRKNVSVFISLNIHRCSINTCFTILKSWWRFTKTETF